MIFLLLSLCSILLGASASTSMCVHQLLACPVTWRTSTVILDTLGPPGRTFNTKSCTGYTCDIGDVRTSGQREITQSFCCYESSNNISNPQDPLETIYNKDFCVGRYGGSCPPNWDNAQVVYTQDVSSSTISSGVVPDSYSNSSLLAVNYCCTNRRSSFLPTNNSFCYLRYNLSESCYSNFLEGNLTWITDAGRSNTFSSFSPAHTVNPNAQNEVTFHYCCGSSPIEAYIPPPLLTTSPVTTSRVTTGSLTSGAITSSPITSSPVTSSPFTSVGVSSGGITTGEITSGGTPIGTSGSQVTTSVESQTSTAGNVESSSVDLRNGVSDRLPLVAGLIAMGVVLLIIITIGIFLGVRKAKRKDSSASHLLHIPMTPLPDDSRKGISTNTRERKMNSANSSRSSGSTLSTKLLVGDNFAQNMDILAQTRRKWEIKYSDCEIQMPPVGSGAYGVVNKGTFRGKLVAVKTFFKRTDPLDFQREVLVLSQLHHPSIINFLGASLEPMAIVTEFADKGSLYDILRKDPKSLNWDRVINILLDCAEGFAYLQSFDPPVIHRDLKTQNILITGDWKAKLCDFGISREKGSDLTMTKVVGTPRWNAPELFDGDSYSEKIDVYSFGIVMWELIARKLPFEDINKQSELEEYIVDGNRPPVPPYCPPIYKEVMEHCWKQAPENRPTFDEIFKKLELSRNTERVEDNQFPDFEQNKPESGKPSRSNTNTKNDSVTLTIASDSDTISNVDSINGTNN